MRDVPLKIRRLRELKNLTQEHLADQLGISRRAYGKIESGHTQLTLSRLDKISTILGCPTEALLTSSAEDLYLKYKQV